MRFIFIFALVLTMFVSCKKKSNPSIDNSTPRVVEPLDLKFATGFNIKEYGTHKTITVTSPWPKSKDTLNYVLLKPGQDYSPRTENTTVIKLPIKKVVVMSTTNIPALEYLNVDTTLVAFPNTKYISSAKTRARIDKGAIVDLNSDIDINMERLLELQPDLVIGFSVNGNHKTLNQIQKLGIPVVLDGAWTEAHPLGRAEWLKFIAAFYEKDILADSIFNGIVKNYTTAKALASNITKKPVVTSGSMFKDVWNIPGGHSFVAKYLKDAHTDYVWKNNTANGSLQLNFENVLEKAQNAELWIGAGAFKTKAQMLEQHTGYSYFNAFKTNTVYTYTKTVGAKGGLLYYELGPLRPDIILKDIINIAHPKLLKNYTNFFFKRLD